MSSSSTAQKDQIRAFPISIYGREWPIATRQVDPLAAHSPTWTHDAAVTFLGRLCSPP